MRRDFSERKKACIIFSMCTEDTRERIQYSNEITYLGVKVTIGGSYKI